MADRRSKHTDTTTADNDNAKLSHVPVAEVRAKSTAAKAKGPEEQNIETETIEANGHKNTYKRCQGC